MDRRQCMRVLGAGGIMFTLGGCDPMPPSAIAGWNGPDPALADVRLRALSWALLAPNPHNQQPWLADIRQSGQVTLYADPARLLPHTDPHSRQILIGCGAFIELLHMAAAAEGWDARVELMPEGVFDDKGIDKRPFARIVFERDAKMRTDPLFAMVRQRRTTRGVYRDLAPPPAALSQLAQAAARPGITLRSSTDTGKIARIGTVAIAGLTAEFRTQATWEESVRLLRFGSEAVAAEPSGLTFVGTKFWLLRKLGLITPERLRDAKGSGPDPVIDETTAAVHSTRAWLWLESADNTRASQIESGRAFVRTGLAAAAAGLAMQPQSQVLQEFAQMNALFAQIHQELGVALPGRVQMLARIGYADAPGPSPRRPLASIIDRRAS